MKKLLLSLSLSLVFAPAALAKLNGDGYYRVCNYKTERYLYVVDNRADIDYTATTVDMNGVELWRDTERVTYDASTILYIKQYGNQYDIQAQGTGIYAMSGVYLNLRYNANIDAYLAYATQSGMTKYLGDPSTSMLKDKSYLKDTASGDYRYWRVLPVDTDANFFGIMPSVKAEGINYASFYADFDFVPTSGTDAFYISYIDNKNGIAVISPIKDNKVVAATPVIIKCNGATPADNKLVIAKNGASKPANNLLGGVYFDNLGEGGHYNRTPFNRATMRVLGVTDKGKLGYITPDLDFLPHNSSYLKVTADAPAQLQIMTEEEYAEFLVGVTLVENDSDRPVDVYTLTGVRVLTGVSIVDGKPQGSDQLPAGIYVANGRKFIIR